MVIRESPVACVTCLLRNIFIVRLQWQGNGARMCALRNSVVGIRLLDGHKKHAEFLGDLPGRLK